MTTQLLETELETAQLGLAEVLELLESLALLVPESGIAPSGPAVVPARVRSICDDLEAVLARPDRLLREAEKELPLPGESMRPAQRRAVLDKGLADALWQGDVALKNLSWTFTRPSEVRRLYRALDERSAPPPPPCLSRTERGEVGKSATVGRPSQEFRSHRWLRRVWSSARQNATHLLAAGILIVLPLSWSIQHATNADARAERAEVTFRQTVDATHGEMERYSRRLAEISRQLETFATPSASQPRDQFFAEFDRSRRFRIQTFPGQPKKLGVILDPFIGPPYFRAVEVVWSDGEEPELLFWLGRKPLEPLIEHDYGPMVPVSGEHRVTVQLRFHLSHAASEKLKEEVKGATIVSERIPVILSPQGIRVASAEEKTEAKVRAFITKPLPKTTVDDVFPLELTLEADPSPQAESGFVHLLVRPLGAKPEIGDKYYMIPFKQRVDDIRDGEPHRYTVWVSLRAILDNMPQDGPWPVHFQILVVELPFSLTDWVIPKSFADFDGELKPAVRLPFEVDVKRPDSDST